MTKPQQPGPITEHAGFHVGQRVYMLVPSIGSTFVDVPAFGEDREDEITYPAGSPALIFQIEKLGPDQGVGFHLQIGEIANTIDEGDGPFSELISATPPPDPAQDLARIRSAAFAQARSMDGTEAKHFSDSRPPDGDDYNDLYGEIFFGFPITGTGKEPDFHPELPLDTEVLSGGKKLTLGEYLNSWNLHPSTTLIPALARRGWAGGGGTERVDLIKGGEA